MWFVYILLCQDGSYYTGATNNLEQRVKDHKNGKGGRYTRSHKVSRLIYSEEHPDRSFALKREAQLKKWPRIKKAALIKGAFSSLG